MNKNLLVIQNNGQDILDTNYWDSEYEKNGILYLSWNSGCARLMIPASLEYCIEEIKNSEFVIISRGPWLDHEDSYELLFEDNSESPFCMHITAKQIDRNLPLTDKFSEFTFSAWTRKGKEMTFPGKYRIVESLPCLESWVE